MALMEFKGTAAKIQDVSLTENLKFQFSVTLMGKSSWLMAHSSWPEMSFYQSGGHGRPCAFGRVRPAEVK